MRWILFITTFVFLFSAFLGNTQIHIPNTFVSYIFYELDFVLQYFALFFVGFCLALFFVIRRFAIDSNEYLQQAFIISFFQIIAVVITGALFAFVLLYIIATVELNIFSVVMNINPAILGVTTDTKNIVKQLQKSSQPPKIIASDREPQKEVIAISQATMGTTNFYSDAILSSVPNFVIIPIQKSSSSLAFIDNILIVTVVQIKDMQAISPIIGNLFVQEYFPNRPIRFYPKVTVMTDKEYLAFRKADANTKLAKAEAEIKKMEDGMSSLTTTIHEDNDAIAQSQANQQSSMNQRDSEYNSCLSKGTYVKGTFQPTFTKDYCQQILDNWNTTLTTQSSQETALAQKLQKDQDTLKEYQYYDNFFKAEKTIISITSGNIPSELGVFEPNNIIKIVIFTHNSHDVGDYFETLVHEYLHYASYTEGKRLDSPFFEEGLTEYFARQTIKDNLDIDTDIGYPVAVKIVEALTQKIAEVDLADIYFSKDQVGLQKKLDLVYGDNFYENNITLFDSLQYTADPQQELEIANSIMKKIGGPKLTQKDLFSTQSNL